jgi:hypothetical protein
MGMDLRFDPALLGVPLPKFDDVDVDDDEVDQRTRRRCWHSRAVCRGSRPAHRRPPYTCRAVPWLLYRLHLHLHLHSSRVVLCPW